MTKSIQCNCIASKFEKGELWFFVESVEQPTVPFWTPEIRIATRFSSLESLWKHPFLTNFLEGRGHDLSIYPKDLNLASEEIKEEWLLPE